MELLITTAALIAVLVVASILLYRRIVEASKEYEGSKEAVRNITFGFTRQLNRLEQGINKVDNKADAAKIVAAEALKISGELKEASLKELESVKSIQDRIESTETTVESIRNEVQKLIVSSKSRISTRQDIVAPIPVQQSGVLEQLTDTELNALKKIADLGEGTVPEIKQHIGLTREHTARMLKKLYESGFIDRSTVAMPYRYNVRKEIHDLLRQQSEREQVL